MKELVSFILEGLNTHLNCGQIIFELKQGINKDRIQ